MSELLAIYLRDHHAAARAGVALAHRTADAADEAGRPNGLKGVANEIEGDLAALEQVMAALDVSASPVKDTLMTVAERVGRLKLNGRVVGRSQLSSVVELEALLVGITAKEAMWRALVPVRESRPQLEGIDLERLIERAQSQREIVDACRLDAAGVAFLSADRAHSA